MLPALRIPLHTLPNSQSNYLVLVRQDTSWDPTVTRLLSLPPIMKFSELHRVLQVAFKWAFLSRALLQRLEVGL